MKELYIQQVREKNKLPLKEQIGEALARVKTIQQTYPQIILEAVNSGYLSRQMKLADEELRGDVLCNPNSVAAGAYFANEDVIGGSRVPDSLEQFNRSGEKNIPGWTQFTMKNKLGPGIGYTVAPNCYFDLLKLGAKNPNLSLNYNAPFGSPFTRKGVKKIMDSRIDPESDIFSEDGVFVSAGATEGVDIALEAVSKLRPNSRVVFLGLSYYTGPFTASNKGLYIDRLIKNPLTGAGRTEFFPTSLEVKQSLPSDTSTLVFTSPNNPNGETYRPEDLKQIFQTAKEKNLFIVFDAIFENMYFDESQNYRSEFLQIAAEQGVLERVIAIDSLSKTKNLAGDRIGFLATTNDQVKQAITQIVLARICNPRLCLEPLLYFEGCARQIMALREKSLSEPLVEKAIGPNPPFTKDQFIKWFKEWQRWNGETQKYYQGNLEIVRAVLDGSILQWSPDQAAFNTFVRMSGVDLGANSMDWLAKLMFTTATYTQVGPCFGLSQDLWDTKFGIWPRITYACSRDDLTEGLGRLLTFTKFYAERNFGDPNKFPILNISYDKQI